MPKEWIVLLQNDVLSLFRKKSNAQITPKLISSHQSNIVWSVLRRWPWEYLVRQVNNSISEHLMTENLWKSNVFSVEFGTRKAYLVDPRHLGMMWQQVSWSDSLHLSPTPSFFERTEAAKHSCCQAIVLDWRECAVRLCFFLLIICHFIEWKCPKELQILLWLTVRKRKVSCFRCQ